MPYKTNADLPEAIRTALPTEAQSVFRGAFNGSYEEHGEETAFKIAWAAVKRGWKKEGDKWVKKASDAMTVFDAVTLDEGARVRKTADGYLLAMPRVARSGIQLYKGSELGLKGDRASDTIRVYRPADEVFNRDSLHSYAYKPVTNDHPAGHVTADNWRKHGVGQLGEEVLRDGDFVRVPMVLMDAQVIKDVEEGKRQLSVGYGMDLHWESGVVEDSGEAYDAYMANIRANHLAVVRAARGGSDLKIGDEGESEMTTLQSVLKSFTVDGIQVEATDMSTAVIQRHIASLEKQVDQLKTKLKSEEDEGKKRQEKDAADHKAALDAKNAEVATLQQQLKDSALTPDKLDALVRDRQTVIEKGKAIIGDKLVIDGKTIADMRRQVVGIKLGDTAKDWSDEMVTASFGTLAAAVPANDGNSHTRLSDALSHRQVQDAVDKAYDDRDKNLENAWKQQTAA